MMHKVRCGGGAVQTADWQVASSFGRAAGHEVIELTTEKLVKVAAAVCGPAPAVFGSLTV